MTIEERHKRTTTKFKINPGPVCGGGGSSSELMDGGGRAIKTDQRADLRGEPQKR